MLKALAVLLLSVLWVGAAHAQNDRFLMLEDARELQHNRVLVLVAEIENCSFCERVKRDYLLPLTKNEQWSKRFEVRRIDISSSQFLYDFKGQKTTQSALAQTLGADFSPTLMFLNAQTGERIGEDIIGLVTPDFYGYYLEQQIDQAYDALHN